MEEFRRPLVEEGTAETPEAVGSHPINLDRQGSVANSLLGDRAPLSDEDDKDGRDVRANRADGEAGAPLLRPNGGESDPQPAPLATLLRSPSFWGATTNLSKVILGASMMTLPRTFNLLGLVAGVCLLVGVGVLTHVTLVGIVAAADIAGTHSYGGTVLRVLGPRAVRLFNVALLLSVLGLEVVVLVVAGDLLVGRPPEYGGLLEEMLPALDPQAWYLDRRTVLAAVTCLLLAPLVSMRNMARLAPVNAVGVASIGLLAACCAGLAAAAAAQGASHPLRLLPDWRGLGDTGVAKAMQLAGLLPMFLNADMCHQSIIPLRQLLQPYRRRGMKVVIGTALTLCNVLYLVIALGTCAAFGAAVDGNILNNMSAAGLEPFVGALAAHLLAHGLRLGFLLSLLGSFVLLMYPLKECVVEIVLGHTAMAAPAAAAPAVAGQAHAQQQQHHHHHHHPRGAPGAPVTYPLLALIYGIAVLVPNIFDTLSFIGATASTLVGFIFPALLMLRGLPARPTATNRARRALAWFVLLLGCALFANGFASLALK